MGFVMGFYDDLGFYGSLGDFMLIIWDFMEVLMGIHGEIMGIYMGYFMGN